MGHMTYSQNLNFCYELKQMPYSNPDKADVLVVDDDSSVRKLQTSVKPQN